MNRMKLGDIVHLNPVTCNNPMFAGCLMVVTEVKTWGAQGYVQALGANGKPGGQAYYRAKWIEFEPTEGTAIWMPASEYDNKQRELPDEK